MRGAWPTVVAAFLLSSVLTRLSMPVARFLSLVDEPGEAKIHRQATPRFGGIGILASVSITGLASGLFGWLDGLGLLAIATTGTLDDRYKLSATQKLSGQAVAGSLLAASIAQPLGLGAGLIAFGAVIVLANGVNVIDGLDGLAGVVALIAACGLAWLSDRLGVSPLLALLVAAASAGFLVWNLPRARTFMGDVGSLSLGYLLALLITRLFAGGWAGAAAGALIVAIPIFDLAVGVVRRLRKGLPLVGPDREHFYDKLATLTHSTIKTLFIVLGVGLGLAVIGALVGSNQALAVVVAWIVVAVACIVSAVKLEMV
jgi:UDP-GlcNAc:undecaprenyl-phosphate GlcNAc-1-phosphate transferase